MSDEIAFVMWAFAAYGGYQAFMRARGWVQRHQLPSLAPVQHARPAQAHYGRRPPPPPEEEILVEMQPQQPPPRDLWGRAPKTVHRYEMVLRGTTEEYE